jgi:hypothetical protein
MGYQEDQVLEYINFTHHEPLYFKEESIQKYLEEIKDTPINNLITYCLRMSESNGSYRKTTNSDITGGFIRETPQNRYRSSFDIWRHILSVKPDTTIFEVLRGFYSIRDDVWGQYCWDVERLVFHLISTEEDPDDYDPVWDEENSEYGLDFYEWENVGNE